VSHPWKKDEKIMEINYIPDQDEYCTSCGLCTSGIGIFKGIGEETERKVSREAVHRDEPSGKILFREGDPAEAIYIIKSGKVKLYTVDSEGREIILDITSPGEILGEDSFAGEGEYEYTAESITALRTCVISRDRVWNLMDESPGFARVILKNMGTRLKRSENTIKNLMEQDALKRTAGFLLLRTERLNDTSVTLTTDEIAASTSLRRETVSRKLTDLKNMGIIERKGQRMIEVKDREKLMDLLI